MSTLSLRHGPVLFLLRHGETFLKRSNRRRFERLLEQNVRAALTGLGETRITRQQGRCFVHPDSSFLYDEALRRLQGVFGLSSVSPALEVVNRPETFIEETAEAALRLLENRPRPASFKVRTRRSDKRFPLTSLDVNRELGGKLAVVLELPVDLMTPELTVGVEVGTTTSFVYLDRLPGAGGLPVGSSGHALLLLSGGIDSPVAGHLAQKRGCRLRALYFHSPPHTSERALDKVERLAARLAEQQRSLSLHVVPFTQIQERTRDGAPAELLVVLYRRTMMRVASRLAAAHGCGAIVTGESLGQVASQTLENLRAIEDAADFPVLRPLIAYDKQDTISLARKLQTFDISTEPHLDCCSLFVPRHPTTCANLERVRAVEARLELAALLDRAVSEARENVITPGS